MSRGKMSQNRFLELTTVLIVVVFLLIIAFVLRGANQAETRDSERISEINILRTALQFHYLDKNHYPIEAEWCSIELNCDILFSAMKDYLPEIPKDPLYSEEGEYSYRYKTTNDGLEYKIHTNLERGGPYEIGSRGSFIISFPRS